MLKPTRVGLLRYWGLVQATTMFLLCIRLQTTIKSELEWHIGPLAQQELLQYLILRTAHQAILPQAQRLPHRPIMEVQLMMHTHRLSTPLMLRPGSMIVLWTLRLLMLQWQVVQQTGESINIFLFNIFAPSLTATVAWVQLHLIAHHVVIPIKSYILIQAVANANSKVATTLILLEIVFITVLTHALISRVDNIMAIISQRHALLHVQLIHLIQVSGNYHLLQINMDFVWTSVH